MTGPIITLIIQAIAGAIGGNAVSGVVKTIDLGPLTKTIAGTIGGGLGGQILEALVPGLGNAAVTGSGFDIAAFAGQLAGGGISGAVVTVVVGLVKNAMFRPKTS